MENLIPDALGKKQRVIANHNTGDIITLLLSEVKRPQNLEQTRKFASRLRQTFPNDGDMFAALWKFLRRFATYVPDKGSEQNLKTPARLISDGHGDCKSYTLFISTFLQNLNIPHKIRFVSFKEYNRQPTHVYVIAGNYILDPVMREFDREKPYFFKLEQMLNKLSGYTEPEVGSLKSFVRRINNPNGLKRTAKKAGAGIKHLAKEYVKVAKRVTNTAGLKRTLKKVTNLNGAKRTGIDFAIKINFKGYARKMAASYKNAAKRAAIESELSKISYPADRFWKKIAAKHSLSGGEIGFAIVAIAAGAAAAIKKAWPYIKEMLGHSGDTNPDDPAHDAETDPYKEDPGQGTVKDSGDITKPDGSVERADGDDSGFSIKSLSSGSTPILIGGAAIAAFLLLKKKR